jgi:oxygen-dependent protoporphyrinogen oxidase
LAAQLEGFVRLSSPVRTVERTGEEYVVRGKEFEERGDAVVLASPSFVTANILADLLPDISEAISGIPFAPVDVVCHGHPFTDVAHPLEGFGVLIPRHEGFRVLGCLWCDGIFPQQAPLGKHLLRTMIGGAHDPHVVKLTRDDLENIVHDEHRKLFGVSREPEFRRIFRHAKGIAQYTRGHLGRVAATERAEQELPGLFFTGASYRGVSVNGCCKDAFRVANLFWKQWSHVS